MNITASLVKELRQKTGLGMMDCKEALIQSKGDMNLAIEELRKSSKIKASKKAGRSAAEGVIATFSNGLDAWMVEINCETDFVAKDNSFIQFSKEVVGSFSEKEVTSLEELMKGELEQKREKLIQKLGENIIVRRIQKSYKGADSVGLYVHTNKKIACILSLKGGDKNIAKDIAMHAAATDPIAISTKDISKETIDKERNIYKAQFLDSGKPSKIIQKMIEGKISKFLSEVCLEEQNFVREPEKKISVLLNDTNAEIISFTRFAVGEGIEKKVTDFASEVMSQIKNT